MLKNKSWKLKETKGCKYIDKKVTSKYNSSYIYATILYQIKDTEGDKK